MRRVYGSLCRSDESIETWQGGSAGFHSWSGPESNAEALSKIVRNFEQGVESKLKFSYCGLGVSTYSNFHTFELVFRFPGGPPDLDYKLVIHTGFGGHIGGVTFTDDRKLFVTVRGFSGLLMTEAKTASKFKLLISRLRREHIDP